MTTPEQQPMLHYWLTHPEAARFPTDRVVKLQIAFAQALRPAVEAVIGNHVQTDTPVIIEGDYLLPGPLPGFVRAVFVHEPDVEQLVHNYRLREPDAGVQRGRAEVSARYGDWLAEQAARYSIPVVAARPWDAGTPSAMPSSSPGTSKSSGGKPASKPTTTLKKTVSAGADAPKTNAPPPANDGVPTHGAGTFTVGSGGTDIVGTGATLVKYRVEVEDGIDWGSNSPWTPAGFATTVDRIIAAPRGWTESGRSPVTNAAKQMTAASWSFQRVSGDDYSVRIRLATPATVDKLCGSYGMDTQGVYSCRFGQTEMINLRRWLKGAPGFPIDLAGYRTMVIDQEMGHFLGFDHMHCPGAGTPAPVMQTQTIDLEGCAPNAHPYTADGTFITGAWAPS
jgi:hypothetical protein